MKRSFSLKLMATCVGLSLSLGTFAQAPKYSRVKVMTGPNGLKTLDGLGIGVDHGIHKKGVFYINDFSQQEISKMREGGLEIEIQIEDVSAYYVQRNDEGYSAFQKSQNRSCGGTGSGPDIIEYETPQNFSLGSMGGYITYSEAMAHFDAMAAMYPNLISARAPIGAHLTANGNPIQWMRISDNATVDETEPELVYTSLIHAREAITLTQQIFYMWYLLENYATDPEVQFLVDNTEMYFIPILNPDGYLYNEQIAPNGGGLWRKNRRPIGGEFGVDLNRNFSYQWAVTGSSSDPQSDVHHGTAPFSEPETSAYKEFAESHDLQLAMNYHSFGDLLLFPFGWQSIQTVDFAQQDAMSEVMVAQNGFNNIVSADLYPAAGDTDDWLYDGDLATKPKVFAFTPEVGGQGDGFWPAQNDIIPLSKSLVYQNLQAAWMVTQYARPTDTHGSTVSGTTAQLQFDVQRFGFQDGGNYTVSIIPVTGIQSVSGPKMYTFPNVLDIESDSIEVTLDPALQDGDLVSYTISVDNGLQPVEITVEKTFVAGSTGGDPLIEIFADNGSNLVNWNGDWGISTTQFVSPSSSITDSPGGDYFENSFTEMTLDGIYDLTLATSAKLNFWAQWAIEANWDYAQIRVSTDDGNSWTPVCGRYTHDGSNNQDPGNPIWDGASNWVEEEVNLDAYLGQAIKVQFIVVTDGAVNEDGFYIDDMTVSITGQTGNVGIEDGTADAFYVSYPMPNPAADYTLVKYRLPMHTSASMRVFNAVGQEVESIDLGTNNSSVRLNTNSYKDGIYYFQILSDDNKAVTKRFSVVR